MSEWQPIETAPSDGTRILCTDGENIHVCYPKMFPRPLHLRPATADLETWLRTPQAGDTWEYFRDDENAPGHSWSMVPTHWMPLPSPPESAP